VGLLVDRHEHLGAHQHFDKGLGRDTALIGRDQLAFEFVVGLAIG
jgi:hypothetical protein